MAKRADPPGASGVETGAATGADTGDGKTGGGLTAEIAQAIERLIIDGAYPGGAKLTEKPLMARFGVSRGTIRAALRKLEADGLVLVHDNRGAYVRSHSLQDALELYDLRCELTAYAARLVAEAGDAAAIARLDALLAQMRDRMTEADMRGYYLLNLEFHAALLQSCGNRRAAELYDALVREAHLHRQLQLSSAAQLQRSHQEHGLIVEAIRAGDAARADAAARAHVISGKTRFVATFGQRQ